MPPRKSQLLSDAGEFAEPPRLKRRRTAKPKPPPDLELMAPLLPEEQEQRDLMKRATDHEKEYPELEWLHHVPNGGWRGIRSGVKMKAAGVKKGVPDLCLPARRERPEGGVYGGLYIEMKRTRNARVSADQKRWIRYLRRAGYAVAVCYGMEKAWTCILWYLSLKPLPEPVLPTDEDK